MRKLAILAGALATACALSACGGTPAGAPSTSKPAPASSTAATFKDVNSLAGALKTQSAAKNSVHVTITGSSQQNVSGSGDLRWDASGLAMSMAVTTVDGQMEMVILGDAIYMKMPPGNEVEPGKPWIKISVDGTDPMSKILGVVVKSMQQNADVSKSFDNMKAAGTLTRSAQEKLDGADVTHYWITIDLAKLAQSQTDPTIKDAMQKALDKGGTSTVNSETWVNKDNLPVKVTAETPGPNGVMTSVTALYTDWGKPVNITAPPAGQVAKMPTLGG